MRTTWTTTCLAAALLACEGAAGAGGAVGPPGAQGPPGPPGDPAPAGAARQLVVKTAAGEVLGPLAGGVAKGAAPYPGPLTVYVAALDRLAIVDYATGVALSNALVVFEAADCSSAPYGTGEMSEQVVAVSGARLFVLTGTTAAPIAVRGALKDGRCIPLQDSGAYYPVQELVDPRYPYAAPLRIAYQ